MSDWRPNPGQQEAFLRRGEFEVLYGGAAGGGKSDALIVEALRDIAHPAYHGLILRRTFPQLQEIVDRCWRMYPSMGGDYRSTEHRWYFPSGAKITLGHLQHETDKYNYQGKEFQLIAFDELTQFLESQYLYLHSRARSSVEGLRPRVRSTTNPGGVGHMWVKQRFIDIAKPGTTYIDPATGLSRAFVPASVYDNPVLMASDPAYIARLESLPKTDRRRLLEGDWAIFEGQVFAELSQSVHGCEPFEIPDDWERFVVMDWGYAKPFSIGWYAVDYDGVLYRYREWYGCKDGEADVGLRMTAQEVAEGIVAREKHDRVKPRMRIADPSIYNRTATINNRRRETVGGSVAEDMQAYGLHWIKADNDRIQGIQQLHKRFGVDEIVHTDTGEIQKLPRFYCFNNCESFWRTVPLLVADENNPEDVDTSMEDHCLHGDTRVLTETGPVRIADLVGTTGRVLTVGGELTTYWDCRLTRKSADIVRLTFDDGTELVCTPDHKILTHGGKWVMAMDFVDEVGSSVLDGARPARCVRVEPAGKADVFCLVADGTHCFAVDGGLIVHNCYDEVRYAAMLRPVKPRRQPTEQIGSVMHERKKMARARKYSQIHGVSIDQAYRSIR